MKDKTKAILTLMILSPLLAELLSGHTPAFIFFNPLSLLLLFLGYSLPLLVIRDLSIRWKIGLRGLFLLGLAYGIINEGLGAKTFLLNTNLPVRSVFDNYSYFLGINFAWAANVMLFHALISVIIPIVFVHYLYPKVKDDLWFSKKILVTLAIPSVITITAIFFSPYPFPIESSIIYFIIFSAIILILGYLASISRKSEYLREIKCGIAPLFLGIIFFLFFGFGSSLLALAKVPVIVFYMFLLGTWILLAFILKRNNWVSTPAMILFGLGVSMVLAISGISNALSKGHPEGIITGIIFEIIFIIAVIKIMRR